MLGRVTTFPPPDAAPLDVARALSSRTTLRCAAAHRDDETRLERGSEIFEGLYRAFGRKAR
jgi:hypothetical protein